MSPRNRRARAGGRKRSTATDMSDPVDALILDLLAYVAPGDKSYAETMESWRTSCPRLPVWEEANDRGLVTRALVESGEPMVRITPRGTSAAR